MSTFHLDITRFRDKVMGRTKVALQKIALEIDQGVVISTPVDTGRARGGWNVGVNNVNLNERTDLPEPGSSERAGTAGPVSRHVLEENRNEIRKADAGDVIFISNNVNYIEELEDGRSRDQAPQGMVAKTLRRFPQIVRESATEAKRENP